MTSTPTISGSTSIPITRKVLAAHNLRTESGTRGRAIAMDSGTSFDNIVTRVAQEVATRDDAGPREEEGKGVEDVVIASETWSALEEDLTSQSDVLTFGSHELTLLLQDMDFTLDLQNDGIEEWYDEMPDGARRSFLAVYKDGAYAPDDVNDVDEITGQYLDATRNTELSPWIAQVIAQNPSGTAMAIEVEQEGVNNLSEKVAERRAERIEKRFGISQGPNQEQLYRDALAGVQDFFIASSTVGATATNENSSSFVTAQAMNLYLMENGLVDDGAVPVDFLDELTVPAARIIDAGAKTIQEWCEREVAEIDAVLPFMQQEAATSLEAKKVYEDLVKAKVFYEFCAQNIPQGAGYSMVFVAGLVNPFDDIGKISIKTADDISAIPWEKSANWLSRKVDIISQKHSDEVVEYLAKNSDATLEMVERSSHYGHAVLKHVGDTSKDALEKMLKENPGDIAASRFHNSLLLKYACDTMESVYKADIDDWVRKGMPNGKLILDLDFKEYGIESMGAWMKAGDLSTYTNKATKVRIELRPMSNGSYGVNSAFPICDL